MPGTKEVLQCSPCGSPARSLLLTGRTAALRGHPRLEHKAEHAIVTDPSLH